MKLFSRFFRKAPQAVIVVSGLPRSGTSMMMKMLEAGGLEVLTDHIRQPNADNPQGYYEFERVKKLPEGDTLWIKEAEGKVVKIISALLMHLPPDHTYKILFMRRSMDEILASQKQMLVRRGEDPDKSNDADMARLFEKHVREVHTWLDKQPNLTYLDVDYNAMLADPRPQLARILPFLGCNLDLEKMAATVNPSLYRQRRS
ncbi:MAG TPA: sulfotransferase [Anaerolineae bacterium]|nr:sulfotransferase [Anaerolineae bacterium]HQI84919.1 sulfotransferase [Anaerolineae bacterium]